ncbi:MAG: creatininase family protein, partial [Bacteroidales bacterium]|nr:creatininase family protein [Bacteroidales bacterium]
IVEYFCQQLHKDIPEKVLILPVMSVGYSEHHLDFPGSLSLQHETFQRQAEDILGSVALHGFKNLIIYNSHGGNLGISQVIVEHFGHRHPECRIVLATWWKIAGEALRELNETGEGGVGHAGEFETSLMMLIAPELVHHEKIGDKQNQESFEWANGDMLRGPKASLYRSMKAMTPSGVFGDVRMVSAEKGQKIVAKAVGALKKIVLDLYQVQ